MRTPLNEDFFAGATPFNRIDSAPFLSLGVRWEAHPKRAALAHLAEDADSPTIAFDRQAHDIETEAQAAGVRLASSGPIVPIEQLLDAVRRDADPTVDHFELDGVLPTLKADDHR